MITKVANGRQVYVETVSHGINNVCVECQA